LLLDNKLNTVQIELVDYQLILDGGQEARKPSSEDCEHKWERAIDVERT
jgi:hypothetical protein